MEERWCAVEFRGVPRRCLGAAELFALVLRAGAVRPVLRALASSHLAAHQQRRGVILGACVDLGARLAQELRAAERSAARSRVERRGARVVASHALFDEGYARLTRLPPG